MVDVLNLKHNLPAKKARTNCADPEEAVWSESSLFAILTSSLWIPVMISIILFESRKRKVFEILGHFSSVRYFLLVDLQDFFSDLGLGGPKIKNKKSSENDQLAGHFQSFFYF